MLLVAGQTVALLCIENTNIISVNVLHTDSTDKSIIENDITETAIKSLNEKNNTPGNSPFAGDFLTGFNDIYSPVEICLINENTYYHLNKFADFLGDLFYPPPIC